MRKWIFVIYIYSTQGTANDQTLSNFPWGRLEKYNLCTLLNLHIFIWIRDKGPSKGDRLIVPSGRTPLRRNSTSGGQESLVPYELLLSFLFPRQPLLLCLWLVPHSRTSLNFPYFRFCLVLSLPKSCWACPLQVPSQAYFRTSLYPFLPCSSFSSCISLSRTSLRSPTFHVCPALSLPKSCWACPLLVPSPVYFLPFPFSLPFRTFLYCGFYLYCVYCFFFPFFLLGFSWKMFCHWWLIFCFFFNDLVLVCSMFWFWCISCVCLHFCLNLVWFFKGVICH